MLGIYSTFSTAPRLVRSPPCFAAYLKASITQEYCLMAHIKDALSALVADSKTGLPATFINLLSILVRSPSVVGAEHSFAYYSVS